GALRDLGGQPAVTALARLARENPSLAIRREAVVTLAALNLGAAVPEIISVLKATTTEADAQALWRALLAIRGAGARLATEVPKSDLPALVARAGVRPAREGGQNDALVSAL